MKPYSRDLRQKIIEAYYNQEGSQRQIAQRFCVSLSFIQNLLKRYRNSGTLDPRPHGGGQSSKLNPDQMRLLAQLVRENQNLTLEQLCHKLELMIGVRISRATMGRIIKKLDLSNNRNNHRTSAMRRNKSKANTNVLGFFSMKNY
ncbi:MAG: transposase [Calothrix sp. MO_167.B42]|nr:transposase [Calothrix sp. MO_167.B42]